MKLKNQFPDSDWAKMWLIFNVGRSICAPRELLHSDGVTWESANNSCWHYLNKELLLHAFDDLIADGLIVHSNDYILLSSSGEIRWEELFLPDWKRSYCEYSLEDNMNEITSPSVETCIRVFATSTLLRLIEVNSIQIAPEVNFRPLYWKRIDSAWTLRFQYQIHPSIRYPIMLICSDLVADLFKSNAFRKHQMEYKSLVEKIEAYPEEADCHLKWYSTLEKNSD